MAELDMDEFRSSVSEAVRLDDPLDDSLSSVIGAATVKRFSLKPSFPSSCSVLSASLSSSTAVSSSATSSMTAEAEDTELGDLAAVCGVAGPNEAELLVMMEREDDGGWEMTITSLEEAEAGLRGAAEVLIGNGRGREEVEEGGWEVVTAREKGIISRRVIKRDVYYG